MKVLFALVAFSVSVTAGANGIGSRRLYLYGAVVTAILACAALMLGASNIAPVSPGTGIPGVLLLSEYGDPLVLFSLAFGFAVGGLAYRRSEGS